MEEDSTFEYRRTPDELANLLCEVFEMREVSIGLEELTTWLLSKWLALLSDPDAAVRTEARAAIEVMNVGGTIDSNIYRLLVVYFERFS